MSELDKLLYQHRACKEAQEWASQYETLAEAWNACERGDWMLWLAGRAGLCGHKELVLAACACARLALIHVPPGEERPRIAIETVEQWARGVPGITLDMVRDAAYAADVAAFAASAYAATRTAAATARAAAYAAEAAFAADSAAAYAADAADAAATARAAASAAAYTRSVGTEYSAAKADALKTCAQLIRARSIEGKWRLYE